MNDRYRSAMRTSLLAVALTLLSACGGTGLNAGKQGGLAWIAMSGMLIAIGIILWFFLGREE